METTPEVVSSNCLLVSEYSESNPTQLSAMELGARITEGDARSERRVVMRFFYCRHCHNEAKKSEEVDVVDRHDVPRHEIKKVVCSLCDTEQDVQQHCINCGVCMGKYFCDICKFFDDDTSKNQYHCDECGICRTGGKDNFFHCKRCGCCYSKVMEKGHRCVEGAMHHNCPVCFEYLFDTVREISVLPCAHTIHLDCVKEMEKHHSVINSSLFENGYRYSCPVCSKSICDMSSLWKKLDKVVWILCNDCGVKSHVQFHIVAHKCLSCNSYNTRQIQGASATPSSSRVTEMDDNMCPLTGPGGSLDELLEKKGPLYQDVDSEKITASR
ncbi:hypothetical protein VNO80_24850 [Phaseolus coccineus]|uniref:Uncharacterized protein n=1 Tax=Phaseolus coccineus TaxID=3886 RepID=A0AAN9LTL9_PHACN